MIGMSGKPEPGSFPVYSADIGGSFIKFAVSTAPGKLDILARTETPATSWAEFSEALAALIRCHVPAESQASPLGLSVAGLIDPKNGTAFSANIPCITGHRLGEEFSSMLGRPVFAANDADCLTLAEANEGTGRGHSVVFCAVMGTGIGGGLAVDGKLVRGAGGVSGEWGHGPVLNSTISFSNGDLVHMPRLPCGCGQSGCVDTIGGARGIERLHRFLHGRDRTSHEVLHDWAVGDEAAGRTIEAYILLVADPLALVVNMTGASIVPVGGGLASSAKLIGALDEAVRGRILNRFDRPLVVPASRQDDGGLAGAAVLARQGGRHEHSA